MLSKKEIRYLFDFANNEHINISASIFDEQGLNLLASYNPKYIKIASTDLNNLWLLRKVAEAGIKMIISTGMSSLGEIEQSVNALHKINFTDIVLMHCVSAYPAKLEDMNLSFIDTLASAFGYPVGFSDHTQGSIAACMAITKNISYLEKHITLDASQTGFDHKYATEPDQFNRFVNDVRQALKAISKPKTKLGTDEKYVMERARRSIYAKTDILPNEVIKEEKLLIVRPPNILQANDIDSVIGKKAKQHISKHTPISFDLIK